MVPVDTLKRAGIALIMTAVITTFTGMEPRAQPVRIDGQRQTLDGSEQSQLQRGSQQDLRRFPRDELQAPTENLLDEVQAIEAQEGMNSEALIGLYTRLGVLYQESGDYSLSAVALDRARQVVTVNYGLYSLEEAPLLRHSIQNAEAIGDIVEVWGLDQELLTLAERHPNDLRTARILRDAADRRIDVLSRYSDVELQKVVQALGCYDAPAPRERGELLPAIRCIYGNPWSRLTLETTHFLSQAINVLVGNGQAGSDEIPAILQALIRISYVRRALALGEHSLRYLLGYQTANSEPWLVRIDTLVRIADWQLLYSRSKKEANEGALATYEQAYESLKARAERASIEQYFSPATPVVALPAFRRNPLISEENEEHGGYIDFEFEITKYGRGRRLSVLDSRNATRADKRNLNEFVLQTRFRPRIVSGQLADSGLIVARYYLSR